MKHIVDQGSIETWMVNNESTDLKNNEKLWLLRSTTAKLTALALTASMQTAIAQDKWVDMPAKTWEDAALVAQNPFELSNKDGVQVARLDTANDGSTNFVEWLQPLYKTAFDKVRVDLWIKEGTKLYNDMAEAFYYSDNTWDYLYIVWFFQANNLNLGVFDSTWSSLIDSGRIRMTKKYGPDLAKIFEKMWAEFVYNDMKDDWLDAADLWHETANLMVKYWQLNRAAFDMMEQYLKTTMWELANLPNTEKYKDLRELWLLLKELAQEKSELAQEKSELAQEKSELAQEKSELAQEKSELAKSKASLAKHQEQNRRLDEILGRIIR